MKWILWSVGVVVGLVVLALAVLAAMSLRPGAGRVAGQVEIDRPPAEVWPWIVEGERLREWVGWLTEVHDLTPGIQGLGARYRWVMIDPTMNNQRVEIEGEVIGWEPGRLSHTTLDSPGMFEGEGWYELIPSGDGRTRVEYVSQFRMRPWFWRLLEPVVTPQASKKALDDLARLKERIEAAPAQTPPA